MVRSVRQTQKRSKTNRSKTNRKQLKSNNRRKRMTKRKHLPKKNTRKLRGGEKFHTYSSIGSVGRPRPMEEYRRSAAAEAAPAEAPAPAFHAYSSSKIMEGPMEEYRRSAEAAEAAPAEAEAAEAAPAEAAEAEAAEAAPAAAEAVPGRPGYGTLMNVLGQKKKPNLYNTGYNSPTLTPKYENISYTHNNPNPIIGKRRKPTNALPPIPNSLAACEEKLAKCTRKCPIQISTMV